MPKPDPCPRQAPKILLFGVLHASTLPTTRALAQEDTVSKICVTPTKDVYDLMTARPETKNNRHRDPAKEWEGAFLTAVQKCKHGDALVIAREALTLAARYCDLDKPIAFAGEYGSTTLCTYTGKPRDER